MNENRVKERTRGYLKEFKKCKIMPKEIVWTPNGLQQQKLDIVGVSPSGKTYVVECKAGVIGRPLQGVGQLTRYRVLIEDFSGFRRKLEELAEDKELKKRITKISKSKFRYYLAVPKHRSKKWNEILQKCCRYLGFKREKEYRDILVFKYEGYKRPL